MAWNLGNDMKRSLFVKTQFNLNKCGRNVKFLRNNWKANTNVLSKQYWKWKKKESEKQEWMLSRKSIDLYLHSYRRGTAKILDKLFPSKLMILNRQSSDFFKEKDFLSFITTLSISCYITLQVELQFYQLCHHEQKKLTQPNLNLPNQTKPNLT